MSGTFCRNLWQSEGRAEGTLSAYSVPSGERTRDMLLPSPLVQGIPMQAHGDGNLVPITLSLFVVAQSTVPVVTVTQQ